MFRVMNETNIGGPTQTPETSESNQLLWLVALVIVVLLIMFSICFLLWKRKTRCFQRKAQNIFENRNRSVKPFQDQDSSGSDAELITLHLTPCDPLEGQEEQVIVTEGQEEQVIVTEGQEEQGGQATITEGPKEQMNGMEGQGSAMGTVDLSCKKRKSDCSYHTRLEAFPIRSVVRERVRKGKAEILVDWEPCPICGKEWAHSWQPKDSLQINEKK
ncbi:early nodulin 2 [Labeo rohita]|uniref:Early nodulin 2 n=1 Tax=Labeo rohita TaxID=84645 RepID=A0A498NS22_LABRO|nr:early nodulin 2 [Labeo rohita]